MRASPTATFTHYCNPEVDKLIFEQSKETDPGKRKQLLGSREEARRGRSPPHHLHRKAATCWHSHVKGIVLQHNSIYNNWRFEDVWLDR